MSMFWRCSLVLNLKWSLQLLFLSAHRTIKPVLPLNIRRHIKGQGLVFFILKILDFVLSGAQAVPMQENLTVTLLVFTSPLRTEMRHLRYFTAFLIFPICSYLGKFWFQKLNIMSVWALHFYEGGNKKDMFMNLPLIISPLCCVESDLIHIIWVSFTLREKIMVTSFEIYANLCKKMHSEYFA